MSDIIYTPRMRLVPMSIHHRKALDKLFNDDAVLKNLNCDDLDTDKLIASAEAHWEQHGSGVYTMFTGNAKVIGRAGVRKGNIEGQDVDEFVILTHKEFWGQGYSTEVGEITLTQAFEKGGAQTVEAITSLRNTPCLTLLKRLGMTIAEKPVQENDHPYKHGRVSKSEFAARGCSPF